MLYVQHTVKGTSGHVLSDTDTVHLKKSCMKKFCNRDLSRTKIDKVVENGSTSTSKL